MKGDDEVDDPPPGVLRWLISCDESGIDGSSPYYGFGTLWMKWQRRGDFSRAIEELRERHGYKEEIKWTSVRRRSLPFYRALVEFFFRTEWLAFHCFVVRRTLVRKELHGGSYDLARRKHFAGLLTNKIERCLKRHPDRAQTFRVWVDRIPSSYAKADEALEVIANNVLRQVFQGARPVDRVFTHDSRERAPIQLCDLLLGAVLDGWRRDATAEHKLEMQAHVAKHLGWTDLRSDTRKSERKFNVWLFHDPTRAAREVETRSVKLLYPLKPAQGRR